MWIIAPIQVNEFARVILGKALQLIVQLEENTPVGATLERMSNQVSKEIVIFDAFTDLNSNAIREVRYTERCTLPSRFSKLSERREAAPQQIQVDENSSWNRAEEEFFSKDRRSGSEEKS